MAKFDPRKMHDPLNMLLAIAREPRQPMVTKVELVDGVHPGAPIKAWWPYVVSVSISFGLAALLLAALLQADANLVK